MKKKLLALVATVFMLFSFVGCSTEGTALMKEMQEVAKWKAASQSGTMTVEVAMGKENCNMTFDYAAYSVTDTLQAEMTITPKTLKVDGETVDFTKGEFKLSPIKAYMDGVKFYISTSYIKELCNMAGADASQALDVSKDYIAFDLTDTYEAMGMDVKELAKDSAKVTEEFYADLAKAGITCPIKQDGRKYTIELSADEMVKAFASIMAQSLETSKDMLVKEYKAMGMTDAQIELTLAQVKAMTSQEALAPVSEMIKDSKVKVTLAYEDGKQTAEYGLNFDINVSKDEKVTIKVDMKDVATKADAKEIKMPTSVTVYTMDQLMAQAEESFVEEEAVVEEATTKEATAKEATAKEADTTAAKKAA